MAPTINTGIIVVEQYRATPLLLNECFHILYIELWEMVANQNIDVVALSRCMYYICSVYSSCKYI